MKSVVLEKDESNVEDAEAGQSDDTDSCALGTGTIMPRETRGQVSCLFID